MFLELWDDLMVHSPLVDDFPSYKPPFIVIRGFPKMGVPQNGWFIMENPTNMDDDWGYPHGLETPISKGFLNVYPDISHLVQSFLIISNYLYSGFQSMGVPPVIHFHHFHEIFH